MQNDHVTRTITVYDTIAQDYADQIENFAPEKERQEFIKKIKKAGRILDVGCAAGRDSFYFAENGFKVIGIDLSEELLKIARKRAPHIDFQKQDMRTLNFPEKSFDGIWACASLLHLKRNEVPLVLKLFYSMLQTNGKLFILVKEGEGEADVVEELSSNLTRHFTFFQKDELKKMLLDTRFIVDKIYTWNSKVRWPQRRDVIWISSFSHKS